LFEFDHRDLSFVCTPVRCYDVAPDGRRFIFTKHVDVRPPQPPNQIHVVLNSFEELKAKVLVR
jgi:hypothetical protein